MKAKRHNILYVDDHEDNLFVFLRLFEDEYVVHTAVSGEEGLKILVKVPIDVVVSDQRMPGMDGIEFLQMVRINWPHTMRMVLTGYADLGNAIDAVNKGGIYRYITKPWDREDMRVLMTEALEAYEQDRRTRELGAEVLKTEKLSAIGKMACSIVHDIKNPLATIRGFVELIEMNRNSIDQETLCKYTSVILSEIDSFFDLTHDILDFARGNELRLNKKLVFVEKLLSDTQAFVLRDLAAEGIEYDLCLDYKEEIFVDEGKLRRVLYNVVGNARDALDERGTIHVHVYETTQHVVFKITDTGCGMPDYIRRTVFEPFVTYGKPNGTGLGLAIAAKIVQAHKGTIECESSLGKGTSLVISIPQKNSM